MTISIEAGNQDCFFQNAKIGEVIDVEYQVIDGGHGDLDTSFELSEPGGRILYADFKKSDNIHRHKVEVEGDYRFCFDNSFSLFNKKTVFFELIIENEDTPQDDDEWNNDALEGLTPEEFYDMKVKRLKYIRPFLTKKKFYIFKVEDIQSVIGRVHAHLSKARQAQDLLKSFEARDRNIAEENYFRVNVWSVFQIFLMLVVGSLQVMMVRSLFETDSKVQTVWKWLCL